MVVGDFCSLWWHLYRLESIVYEADSVLIQLILVLLPMLRCFINSLRVCTSKCGPGPSSGLPETLNYLYLRKTHTLACWKKNILLYNLQFFCDSAAVRNMLQLWCAWHFRVNYILLKGLEKEASFKFYISKLKCSSWSSTYFCITSTLQKITFFNNQ